MKIAIVGASSFIGKALLRYCSEKDAECIAVGRPGTSAEKIAKDFPKTSVLAMEMHDYCRLGEYLPGLDCLVMLSWGGTRGAARMDKALQQNNYTCVLDGIKSAVKHGCKKIIVAGSQAEYGSVDGIITEETTPCPNTEYGKAKLQLYRDASDYCKKQGVKLIEPRFFSLYGIGDSEKTLVMDLISKMMCNQPCDLTKCVQLWDFLYVDDAVEALYDLIASDSAEGIYNFGSGDRRPLKAYVEEVKEVLGSTSKLNYGAVPYPETGMVSIQPDVSRLMDAISWYPKTSFAEGVKKIADWCDIHEK